MCSPRWGGRARTAAGVAASFTAGPRTGSQPGWAPGRAAGGACRVGHLLEEPPGKHLLLREQAGQVMDGPAGDLGPAEVVQPDRGRAAGEERLQQGDQLLAVGHPGGVGGEAGLLAQGRPLQLIQEAGQPLPGGVVPHRHDEVGPIQSPESLVRDDAGMARAVPARLLPGGQVALGGVGEPAHRGVQKGDLHPLALARPLPVEEGGQDRLHRVEAGAQVDDGHPHPNRLPRRGARDGHQAPKALHHHVVARLPAPGARLAEA